MPKRLLRDWTDSEPVNALSTGAEVFFLRLIMKADDFGRFHGSPRILRPLLFPLQLDRVSEATLDGWTAECVKASLIRLYEADGKRCLEIRKFDQRLRAMKSKFPGSPSADSTPLTSVSEPPSDDGQPRPETETRDERRETRVSRATARSRPPSLEEARGFWIENELRGDPERFWNHHEAAGWRIGSGTGRPIRDWHAAARNWSGRESEFGGRGKRDGSLDGLKQFAAELGKEKRTVGPNEIS